MARDLVWYLKLENLKDMAGMPSTVPPRLQRLSRRTGPMTAPPDVEYAA